MKILVMLLMVVPLFVFGGNAKKIKDHLSITFDIKSVSLSKGLLEIVVDENIITSNIYYSLFENGIMIYSFGYGETDGALKSVKKVLVLNKHKNQGFVFVGTESDILKLGKLKRDEFRIELLKVSKKFEYGIGSKN